MKKDKQQIVVSLEKRRNRRPASIATPKELAARKKNAERLKADKRFTDNTRPGVNNGNPKGYNQYTHPQGNKNISAAMKVYVNDKLPACFADKVRAVGLDPDKATFADVIAMKQLLLAVEGSLASTQYVQDNDEDKMKGPNGPVAPKVMEISFVDHED